MAISFKGTHFPKEIILMSVRWYLAYPLSTRHNEAAIKSYNAEHGTPIVIRKTTYLHNILEQDPRAVKRITRPMLGFKAFDAAQATFTGIELMHMLRKGQLAGGEEAGRTAAEQCYALAA